MINYYTFKEVSKNELHNVKQITKNHKFLFESLNKEIKYYKEENSSKEYINFFDKIFFEIESFNSKPKKFDFFAFQVFKNADSDDRMISDLEISRIFRGSNTFIINQNNSYDSNHLKVVFAENGFCFVAKKYEEQQDMFEKNYILYLLAQAYNLYTQKLITETSACYKSRNIERMLELRKEIYIFDLNCFFSNPVDYKKQQLHSLWNCLEKIYLVQENHKEMKSQIKDLVNLIELDNKEEEKRKYREEIKEREIKRSEEKERHRQLLEIEQQRNVILQIERDKEAKKSNRRTYILTVIGVLFTALSIGSVYADLVELGAVKNIFGQKEQINLNQQNTK